MIVAAPVRLHTTNLDIEYGLPRSDGSLVGELRPGFERMAIARYQFAVMSMQWRERPKAVGLRLEHELRVTAGLRNVQSRIGACNVGIGGSASISQDDAVSCLDR
jgi:hypothetical protein